MKKKDSPQIEVRFGAVSITTHVAIPISIKRGDFVALKWIDEWFSGRRLTGSILARPEGAHAGQEGLFNGDGDQVIDGQFDVRSYTGNAKEFTATLIMHAIRLDALKFRGRNGLVRIDWHEAIPVKANEPKEEAQLEESVA